MQESLNSAIHPEIEIYTLPALVGRGRWRLQSLQSRQAHVFLWITRGQGQFRVGSVLRGFGPNSVLFIPAGLIHAVLPSANTQGYVGFLPENLPVPVPDLPGLIKATSIFDQGQMTGYFEQISLEYGADNLGSDHVIESYLTLLSVWIERNQSRNDWHNIATQPAANRLADRFLRRLEDNHQKSLSVSTYAAVLDVTPPHLGRVCRDILGKPTSELVQNRVILAAKYALADSDQKINSIANDLGFSSPAYFTRLFRQQAGLSPREFRVQALGRQGPTSRAGRKNFNHL